MPRFEQMMDALALDQARRKKPRETSADACTGPEALHVHAAWQIKELFLREPLHPECVRRHSREDDEQVSQFVFLQETFALEEEIFLPAASLRRRGGVARVEFAAIAVPGREFPPATECRGASPRGAIAGNRPTSCERGRIARSRAAALRTSRDTSFSRRSSRADRANEISRTGCQRSEWMRRAGISFCRLS